MKSGAAKQYALCSHEHVCCKVAVFVLQTGPCGVEWQLKMAGSAFPYKLF